MVLALDPKILEGLLKVALLKIMILSSTIVKTVALLILKVLPCLLPQLLLPPISKHLTPDLLS